MKKLLIGILSISMAAAASHTIAQPWTQVQTPNAGTVENWFRGISGTSASDVWAVGHTQTNTGLSSYASDNVIMHWNGTNWTSYPVSNPGTDINELWSVAAVSSNEAWAVGDYTIGTNLQLLKWNGTSWTQQSLGTIANETFLRAVTATSASDVWAVGGKSTTIPLLVEGCLALHYNGTAWTQVTVPAVGTFRNRFNAIHGISTSDVWAAGTWGNAYADFNGLLMHWNGTAWSNSPLTATFTEIWDVKMISSNDVWAIGEKTIGGAYSTLHWNGTAWTEYALPGEDSNVFTTALAVKPNHEVYAFGNHIHKWNGTAWTMVDSLTHIPYANVRMATVLPTTGEIWACGRYFDTAANYYKNLVLHSDSGSGTGTTGIRSTVRSAGSVQAYPNPFRTAINLHIIADLNTAADITIKDVLGRTVQQQPASLHTGENNLSIRTPAALADGLYMLEVKMGTDIWKLRLVKE